MNMVRTAVTAFAIATASIAGAQAADTAAPAPVGSEPQKTSATYGDWTLTCSKPSDTAPRSCEVVQSFQLKDQQGLFALLAIGNVGPKEPLKITFVMPPNISFPSTVKLAVDDKDTQPVELVWLRCLPGNGCFAAAGIKDDQLKKWRAQSGMGQLVFKDGAGRDIAIPFSFRGLAQALDGLAKS